MYIKSYILQWGWTAFLIRFFNIFLFHPPWNSGVLNFHSIAIFHWFNCNELWVSDKLLDVENMKTDKAVRKLQQVGKTERDP